MATVEKPTLIHLQNSSSQTILWVLEELGIEYNIRKFSRPTDRRPEELKETHPQGKSPQLITADGRVITQASAIILYLLRTYDAEHRFHRPDVDDPVREEILIGVGVADLTARLSTKMLLTILVIHTPFFIRPILSYLGSTISRLAVDQDIQTAMEVLEAELGERDWFMGGDTPSRPDFILHFCIGLVEQPKFISLEDYPKLAAWMARCDAREAWKRSLEKGNGYDLDYPGMYTR